MKIALYIRVSTDEQAKSGYSLTAQEEMLKREAAKINGIVTKIYVDDGYSAKNMNRPALKKMIKEFTSNEFDTILFWRLDRLTRRSKDFHKMVEKMHEHNIGMISVYEKIDTTSAIGRFQLELSVSLAQLERETTSERVTQVMEERAKKGLRNGGPSALGYKIENKKYVVNPNEVDVVKEVFRLYLEGNGLKTIAHIMLANKDTSSILNWSGASVKYILQNPLYVGKRRYNYVINKNRQESNPIITESDHEAIIDEETFERVQEQFKLRTVGGKSFTGEYVFSSILRCGKCGARMQGFGRKNGEKIYKTYRCADKIEKGTCDFSNVRENGVSEALIKAIDFSQFDMKTLNDVKGEKTKDAAELKSRLMKITEKKKRFREAFANELMTLEELKEHLEELNEMERKINAEIDNTSEKIVMRSKEEIIELLKELKTAWKQASDKSKKLFLQEIFEYIVIDLAPGEISGHGRRPKLVIKDFKFR